MKTLQEKILALQALYRTRRLYFKQSIDSMQGITPWGTRRLRGRGLALLGEAEQLMQELEQGMVTTAEGSVTVPLRKRYHRFKKVYALLHEFTKPWWRQWAEAIGIALLLAVVLRNFIFGLYHVPTGSAEPTILVGDRIWGNKLAYYYDSINRGDLVIFDDPLFPVDKSHKVRQLWQRYIGIPVPALGLGAGPTNWVKRVIAVPGDTIEGRLEQGKTTVYLNGKKLEEPYVNPYPLIHVRKERGFFPVQNIGPLLIPDFLRQEKCHRRYTYDPAVSLEQQPFYKLKPEEIIANPLTGQPILDHPFTPTLRDSYGAIADQFGPIIVPEGKYWVMGDSRKNSADSRIWLFLDKSLIHGRASFIIYSLDSEEAFWAFDLIKHPLEFWTKIVRWGRTFSGFKSATVEQQIIGKQP
ncbi:signal peptidase I [bacterium]|nr:signal peptidase I [bacterium]